MTYTFTIQGDPVPKGRPRVYRGHANTPPRTVAAEKHVAFVLRAAGLRPLPGPVHLLVRFFRGTARRCDIDNLVKLVMDALNGIAWTDDDQVVLLTASKLIDREKPRTEISISAVPAPIIWDEAA